MIVDVYYEPFEISAIFLFFPIQNISNKPLSIRAVHGKSCTKILENINDKLFVQYPYTIPFINAYRYKEANQYIELISFDLLQFIMH